MANAIALLRGSPEWQGVLAFDHVTQRIMVCRAPPFDHSPFPGEPWQRHHDTLAAEWMQRHGVFCNIRDVAKAIEAVAHERAYDRKVFPECDAWYPLIEGFVRHRIRVTMTEIMVACLNRPGEYATIVDQRRASRILQDIGFRKHRGGTNKRGRWFFYSRETPLLPQDANPLHQSDQTE